MKKYEVYKNIRKRAVLFGLPLSLFALMMCSILCSLMIIIFSFSLLMVIGVPVLNAGLYIVLLNLERSSLDLPAQCSLLSHSVLPDAQCS